MDITWSEISKISSLVFSVGGVLVALFQVVFFRKVSKFPIKPEKQFVIGYLEKREHIILFLTISFYIIAAVASVAVTTYFEPATIGMKIIAFVVPIVIGVGLVLIYMEYILKPLSVNFTRALFSSLGYDQDDFHELINEIESTEYVVSKDVVYEALGKVYTYKEPSKQGEIKTDSST